MMVAFFIRTTNKVGHIRHGFIHHDFDWTRGCDRTNIPRFGIKVVQNFCLGRKAGFTENLARFDLIQFMVATQ